MFGWAFGNPAVDGVRVTGYFPTASRDRGELQPRSGGSGQTCQQTAQRTKAEVSKTNSRENE